MCVCNMFGQVTDTKRVTAPSNALTCAVLRAFDKQKIRDSCLVSCYNTFGSETGRSQSAPTDEEDSLQHIIRVNVGFCFLEWRVGKECGASSCGFTINTIQFHMVSCFQKWGRDSTHSPRDIGYGLTS